MDSGTAFKLHQFRLQYPKIVSQTVLELKQRYPGLSDEKAERLSRKYSSEELLAEIPPLEVFLNTDTKRHELVKTDNKKYEYPKISDKEWNYFEKQALNKPAIVRGDEYATFEEYQQSVKNWLITEANKFANQTVQNKKKIRNPIQFYQEESTKAIVGQGSKSIVLIDFVIDALPGVISSIAAKSISKALDKEISNLEEFRDETLNYDTQLKKWDESKREDIKSGNNWVNDPDPAKQIDYSWNNDLVLDNGEGHPHNGKVLDKGDELTQKLNRSWLEGPITSAYFNNMEQICSLGHNGLYYPLIDAINNQIFQANADKNLADALAFVLPKVTSHVMAQEVLSTYCNNVDAINKAGRFSGERWKPDEGGLLPTDLPTITDILDATGVKYSKTTAKDIGDTIFYSYPFSENFSVLRYNALKDVHENMTEENSVESLERMVRILNRKTWK